MRIQSQDIVTLMRRGQLLLRKQIWAKKTKLYLLDEDGIPMQRGGQPFAKSNNVYLSLSWILLLNTCVDTCILFNIETYWYLSETRSRSKKKRKPAPHRSVRLTKSIECLGIGTKAVPSTAHVTFSLTHDVKYLITSDQSSGTLSSSWILLSNTPVKYSYGILLLNTRIEYFVLILQLCSLKSHS